MSGIERRRSVRKAIRMACVVRFPSGLTVNGITRNISLDGVEVESNSVSGSSNRLPTPGEAGLLMCTWPKDGALDAIPGQELRPVENPEVWTGPGGYFNECMNGFEYQVAAHMVYEGEPGVALVERGLAIAKAVHERSEKR